MCEILHFHSLFLHLLCKHPRVLPLASCWNSTHYAPYLWIFEWARHSETSTIVPPSSEQKSETKQEDWMASTVFSEVLVLGAMRAKKKHLLRVPQTVSWASKHLRRTPPHRDCLLTTCSLCNKKQSRWLAFWAAWSQDLRKEKWKKEFVVSSMWAFQLFYVPEQYFQTLIFTNHFPSHVHICISFVPLLYDFFFIKWTHYKK